MAWMVAGLMAMAGVIWSGDVAAQADETEGAEETAGPSAGANEDSASGGSDDLSDAEQKKFDKLVQEARLAYSKKRWDEALKKFEQAYAIKSSTNLLFNMGLISEKSGNLGKAVEYYEKFVSAPGISLDMRKKVQERLEVLQPIVDNEEKKKKEAEQKKMATDQELKKSEQKEESPDTQKQSEASGSDGGPTNRSSGGGGSVLPKILTISGGASLLASGGLLLAAQSNAQTFENAGSPAGKRKARRWHRTNTYIGDGLLIAGAGLATTGLVMWLTNSGGGQTADVSKPTVTPAFSAEGFGLSISGAF
jgi:tetratricopeptide (TPR) repeat protein